MTYSQRYTNKPTPSVVHIEVLPAGNATMTFKNYQSAHLGHYEGKVIKFKHPRDAVAYASHNGFETIQRDTHPQYFSNHGRCDYFSPSFRYNERCSKFQQEEVQ
jgi:alpha-galactosidase